MKGGYKLVQSVLYCRKDVKEMVFAYFSSFLLGYVYIGWVGYRDIYKIKECEEKIYQIYQLEPTPSTITLMLSTPPPLAEESIENPRKAQTWEIVNQHIELLTFATKTLSCMGFDWYRWGLKKAYINPLVCKSAYISMPKCWTTNKDEMWYFKLLQAIK